MIKIPCPNPSWYFLFEIDDNLEDCDAKVSPHFQMDPVTGEAIPGCCGTVYFKRDALRAGVIAHESTHMAFAYMRTINGLRTGITLSDECDAMEEYIAITIGYFAPELTKIYWSLSDEQVSKA